LPVATKNISRRRFLTTAAAKAAVWPFIIDIAGLDNPKKMCGVTEARICSGYSDDDIRAVLGGNFKRVLGEIWAS
jgi:microsomal dipeptidase-like Zn-dependent dipeptidase